MQEDKNSRQVFNPLSEKGWPKWGVYAIALFGLVYLFNPTAGVLELIPDNLPGIGNIDEGAAAMAVWYGILEFRSRKKNQGE